jgi:hypothetical protein
MAKRLQLQLQATRRRNNSGIQPRASKQKQQNSVHDLLQASCKHARKRQQPQLEVTTE